MSEYPAAYFIVFSRDGYGADINKALGPFRNRDAAMEWVVPAKRFAAGMRPLLDLALWRVASDSTARAFLRRGELNDLIPEARDDMRREPGEGPILPFTIYPVNEATP